MRALVFDHQLRFETHHPLPEVAGGWAQIQVLKAGICGTDLEIINGYKGFRGVLGHEFVGTVAKCNDSHWIGRRVVGEITISCGRCGCCVGGMERHCLDRKVLGILNHDGCMAEYCALPVANLREVPSGLSDDQAVFTEPLSAACTILQQLPLEGTERVVVLGDGRLGMLCAWMLSTAVVDVTLIGRHPEKLALASWRHLKTALEGEGRQGAADVVIEATGRASGLAAAIALCRPRGTIVLKSTIASRSEINLTPLVVNEQTLIGSRCGRFEDGIRMLQDYPDLPLERLISARYPLEQGLAAFAQAAAPETLKVLIEVS